MITSCRNIQVLEPDPQPPYDVTDNTENSLAVEESGALALTVGQTVFAIVFAQAKLSAEYDFIQESIEYTGSGSAQVIGHTIASRIVDGFQVLLDQEPTTAEYVFRWRVRVNSLA